MSNILVVYFSRGDEEYNVGNVHPGNTEMLAKEIIGRTSADEFKIVPVNTYPQSYMECVDLATKEKNENARPEYQGDIDISGYDTVFFGYPIWWGDLPMICYTFLENHDFANKTLIPFNTHEGSGNSNTYERLQQKFPIANFAGGGFSISGHEARTKTGLAKLGNWLQTL